MGPRPPAHPRPRAGPHLEAVVDAAVSLADAEGIDALSMRRVAERLGVGAMSLYTYVPGKAELVDLMLDRVYAEQLAGIATEGGWRARLESWARADWALYEGHPWVVRAAAPAPRSGPTSTDGSRPPSPPSTASGYRRRDGGRREPRGRLRRRRRPRHRRGRGRGRDPPGRGSVVAPRSAVLERADSYTDERFPVSTRLWARACSTGVPTSPTCRRDPPHVRVRPRAGARRHRRPRRRPRRP